MAPTPRPDPGLPLSEDLRRRLRQVLALGTFLFLLWLFWRGRPALPPFLLGLFLAYLLLPLVRQVEESLAAASLFGRPFPLPLARILAILLGYSLIFALLLLALSFLLPPLLEQSQRLIQQAPSLYQRGEALLSELIAQYQAQIPASWRSQIEGQLVGLGRGLLEFVRIWAFRTLTTFFSTLSFLFGFLVVPFWLFFLLYDRGRLAERFWALVPPGWRQDVRYLLRIADDVLGGYLRGQLLLGGIVGTATALGLRWIGLDAALLLGVVAGIFELLPVVGPILGAIPPLLLALVTDPSKVLWVLVLAAGIQQLENNLLVPRIIGETVRLHPVVVMVALAVAGQVFGLVGALLAVPLTALARDWLHYLFLRTAEVPCAPDEAYVRVMEPPRREEDGR